MTLILSHRAHCAVDLNAMHDRRQLGHMPFVALVVGGHERFSAQDRALARGLDSLSVTTSPTRGIAPLSAAATTALKAKQPLGGMVIAVIARHA
jgi:hypothetical protein